MTSLLRRTSCYFFVLSLAACSSGGPQSNTTLLPTTSSQIFQSTPSSHRPEAVNAYLVLDTQGAFSKGNCYGSPSAVSDILSSNFASSNAAVGPMTTCDNAPGGFTSTAPLSTKPPTVSLTEKGCFPYGVNDKGLAVGRSTQAAYLNGSQCVSLPNLPGDKSSGAYGVDDAGTIVGYSQQCTCGGMKHPVEWVNHQIVALGSGLGEAVQINKHGLIIGSLYDSSGNPTAVIWTSPWHANKIGNLVPGAHLFGGQINDAGHATMYGTGGTYFYNGTSAIKITQTLPGDSAITPIGLDNQDNIYGVSHVLSSRVKVKGHYVYQQSHLVLLSKSSVTDLQTLVPPTVKLLPGKITTGYGGSGFGLSGGTGVIITPAQERIDLVKRASPRIIDTRVVTKTVFLIPPGCSPPANRRR